MTGRVYLIGAGPGDPDLITVKGLACLRRADVVLYDRLAPAELLAEAPAQAELIDVGKAPTRHRRSQDRDQRPADRARASRPDGRAAQRRGPVSSLAAAEKSARPWTRAGIGLRGGAGRQQRFCGAAYAGIPLTQRGVNTAFTVLTGHSLEDGGLDWEAVPAAGTLVLLMGVENLAPITAELIRRGRDPQTPAAVIQNGTTRRKRVITGPLAEIAALARSVQPPAIPSSAMWWRCAVKSTGSWREAADGRNADPVSA
jgi:siroheme synthase